MNNAVYATYLEEARDGWLEQALGGDGSLWDYVLARVAIDFRSEVGLGEKAVLARVSLARIGRSSLTLREEIRKLDGTLAAEAERARLEAALPVDDGRRGDASDKL